MNISLIIPIKNDYESFIELYSSLNNQILKPKELIIIDSSSDQKINEYIKKNQVIEEIQYFHFKNKYPGEGRNIGIKQSKYEHIAFLDSKTIPCENWLLKQAEKLKKNKMDIIFGSTKYKAITNFQKLINSATFGNISHVTTPGTLIRKKILLDNFFIEGVRTADDLEWRQRLVSKNYKIDLPKNHLLIYKSLPTNLFLLLKRYFIYSFHTAQVNVDNRLKLTYFSLITFFFVLIIPRWNQYIPGWNINHPLYIQSDTKFYLLLIISVLMVVIITLNFPYLKNSISNFFIKFLLVVSSIFIVYNWNYLAENWIQKSAFYIPHVTKIYLILIFLASYLIRGVYYPLKRKTPINNIFPINWIKIGFFGLLIDVVKAPAYLYGAVLPKFILKKNFNNFNNNNLVFYPKYKNKSPSYRTRFHSFKDYLNTNLINVETKELFDEKFYIDRIFKKKLKLFKIFYFYLIRIQDLIFRKKPFIAIIHVELLPYVPYLAEYILNIRKIPYIIDIDDAVYYRFKDRNNLLFWLDKKKFNYMMKNSVSILAGNNFHFNYFKHFNNNVKYFPTTIDFNRYKIPNNFKKNNKFTIVWIGTPSTTFYLKNVVGILNKIKQEENIEIKIIGADKKIVEDLNCDFIDWTEEGEIRQIASSHLGIMPLNNSTWELGKCAYKILQYMALKLPVVASPVGVNKEIIIDNKNGMLAKNDYEWYSKILKILKNDYLREEIANNGYETVKKQFNLDDFKLPYLNNLKNI